MRRMFGNAFQPTTHTTTANTLTHTDHIDLERSKLATLSHSSTGPITSTNPDLFRTIDEEFLPDRLPFGTSRASSLSNPSNPHPRSPYNSREAGLTKHTRTPTHNLKHYRLDSASVVGTSFSDSPRARHHSSSINHPFCGQDLKSKMMLQLLSSQAIIEANSFQILPFHRVERLKKDQVKLESRLTSISSKISLERKIRDATLTVIESGFSPNDSSLEQSNSRLDQLRQEQELIQFQLNDIRTKLLQHLSAILSLSIKKFEQNHTHDLVSPIYSTQHDSISGLRQNDHSRSPSPALTDTSRSTIPSSEKFDGPHLFANNLDSHLTSRTLHPSTQSLSNSILDTGQLSKYERTIVQQTAELDQLRSELANLRQSSPTAVTDRLKSQADQLERLRSELQVQHEGTQRQSNEAHAMELDQLRREMDSFVADLERERSNLSGDKQALSTRTRETEDRARLAESRQRQLEADLDRLRLELESAQEAKDSVRTELVALQATVARLADQKADSELQQKQINERLVTLNSEKAEAVSQLSELKSTVSKLEAENSGLNQAVDRLQAQNAQQQEREAKEGDASKLADTSEWDSILDRAALLAVHVSSNHTDFAHILEDAPSRKGHEARSKWVGEVITQLESYLSHTSTTKEAELKLQLDHQKAHNEEREAMSGRVSELEAKLTELQSSTTLAASSSSVEVEHMKQQIANTEKRMEEATTTTDLIEKSLKDLFKSLPANADTRARLDADADLGSFRQGYESQNKKSTGLGGLFGIGKKAVPTAVEEAEYTFESFVDRVKLLVESDNKLVERLIKYETEKDLYKTNALRAQKIAEECQSALKTYQAQVKELEERLEYSDNQSAAMLDKFNDLMESEEKALMLAKKSEISNNQIQSLSQEIEKFKFEIESKEDEMKKAAIKSRHAIEDLEGEISSLKLKLRQAERK